MATISAGGGFLRIFGKEDDAEKTTCSENRIAAVFLFLAMGILVVIVSLYVASGSRQYQEAAAQQSTYTITAGVSRGTIYDTNLQPLINATSQTVAAVAPSPDAANAITAAFSSETGSSFYSMLSAGTPFLLTVPKETALSGAGIDLFSVPDRYGEEPIAVHTIGYLDADGIGVAGIEMAFDDVLREYDGKATVQYPVDALGHVLSPEERIVADTLSKSRGGVVLTLDQDLQRAAERIAKRHLQSGAIVVTEVATGKLRALVSLPDFSPENVAAALEDQEAAPLLNRALEAYPVGSVFKLVSAAAALESGISPLREYTCTGGLTVSGAVFHCFDGIAHGTLNMRGAIAASCNGYFIDLMQDVPVPVFLKTAQSCGFGQKMQLAKGMVSAPGVLPEKSELQISRALANFSFGQGELTASPLQIASLTNTIASGGICTELSLIEGFVDADGAWTAAEVKKSPKRILSADTAAQLQAFMEEAVESGTAANGKPMSGGAGAKTGTAQTGRYRSGEEVLDLWYTGYFPKENPQYTITVLADERIASEGSPCAKVFAALANAYHL